ncbi:hypothetical protein K490DRAFT_58845 [Saccharata proteae CBS 121410]|uniref:RING-type domain-containing protein n=1 Tax=Saccharata proteae CBS 121410 TaxID=1314787 RepID=A0A9P4LUT2_9PEZI|nr:hypothetical protein K490DRAFT_58845 [Saccharata proteae CBS 121410]
MAEDPKGPAMDLEKELRCAICTDVLFQPLTLLDCLHTFCGACLKEWFSLQASTATSAHPYTCPSCRASVRATQKDARVTTLLEMFLQANPDRGKSEEEKEDQRKIYKPGDVVMPKLRRRQQDPEDDRLMAEIRELSLREVGVGGGATEEPRDRRRRDRSREHRETEGRRYRTRDTGSPITAGDTHPDYRANGHSSNASPSPRPTQRQIEHQSSLRSLLSASEFDSEEMEAEIMRQIREEGLLDGIDLENIDRSQEEEISEHVHPSLRQSLDVDVLRQTPPHNNSSPSLTRPQQVLDAESSDIRPSSSSAAMAPSSDRPVLYPEPSILCARCGKTHIEYSLHYHCSICAGGHYDLCIRCYRAGKGCIHWFGFGNAALRNYQNKAPIGGYPSGHEEPHTLIGRRYLRPSHASRSSAALNDRSPILTTEDPAQRLQSGVFCEMCHAFANGCYWKCDICNEGAWGFCNSCVNQGRHCTHPLLPLQHNTSTASASTASSATSSSSITPKSASLTRGPGSTPLAKALFRPLSFSTLCDICAYPIPPSHTRFHCPRCNAGNSDICTSCYHGLVASGRIGPENGQHGWRRCPHGHRMVVVGFEDRAGGQRRVVVRDLVGGLRLREEDDDAAVAAAADALAAPSWSWRDADGAVRKTRTRAGTGTGTMGAAGKQQQQQQELRFPPDGGVGARAVALWGYWPGEGVVDELLFPKGAEVAEVEDINGDWFFGCYAGAKGLFPGTYVRRLW